MIYLNHSGTSYPKPDVVLEAMKSFHEQSPKIWNEIYEEGLNTAVKFFNIPNKDRFIFTTSCTEALAIAFSDYPWQSGDRLIISSMEHHSLSRWFHKLQSERGVEGVLIPRSDNGPFNLNQLEVELKKGAEMVALSIACNVTGEILPYKEILKLCRDYNVKCLLDGAQAAGVIPLDLSELKPDMFVFAGHKGPKGPQGIGGLYIDENINMLCPSAVCEITPGSSKPAIFPTYCDTGSVNIQALAGLTAGMKWVLDKGIESIQSERIELMKLLQNEIEPMQNITILGSLDIENRVGTISIVPKNMTVEEASNKLWELAEVKAGTGFQCSPMAHESLGSGETGSIRISVGPTTTTEEIHKTIEVLQQINSF